MSNLQGFDILQDLAEYILQFLDKYLHYCFF